MSVSGGTMSGRRPAPLDPISAALAQVQDIKAFEARLKKLAEAERSMAEERERYTQAKDIAQAKQRALAAREKAEEVLTEATEMATRRLAEADEKIKRDRTAFVSEKNAEQGRLRTLERELTARSQKLKANEEECASQLASLQRQERTLKTAKATADKLKEDLRTKLSILKAACAEASVDG
jgi:chromosome segregation ATPase